MNLDQEDVSVKKSISRNQQIPCAIVISIDSMPGLQAARILAGKKIPVIALAKDPKHHSCRTNVCEEIIITNTESEQLITTLVEIGPTFSHRPVLFPCQDTDVLLISRYRNKLEKWYHIVLPEPDVVEILMDKMRFHGWAETHGFPVPQTCIVNNNGQLEEMIPRLTFPCLLKPTKRTPAWIEHTSSKAFIISDKDELLSVFDRHKQWADSFVVQQLIEGDDTTLYSCNCYFDRNALPKVTFIARKIRQWPPRTGQSCLGEECKNDVVLNVSLDVFKKANFRGLGYLEMKYDTKTQKHYIIEPNIGRPTGRSAIAEAGGVELLYTMYRDAIGQPILEESKQTYTGVKWIHLLRDLQSSFYYWREGELTLKEWCKSIRGKKAYAIFSWSDPLPFLSALWAGFLHVVFSKNKT